MRCDINCDLGEGFGAWTIADDDALLAIVTSANVACGFHAGDPSTMRQTCEGAVAQGVRIGAHIGYRDLIGFGRRDIAMKPQEVVDEALYQIGGLDAMARSAGDRVRYVKPHGALYHSASRDDAAAEAIVRAVAVYDRSLTVLGPADSCLHRAADDAGVAFRSEGFADRAYTDTGALADRRTPHALLDANHATLQAVSLATTGTAEAVGGGRIGLRVQSICVHGDSPGALDIARSVRGALEANGVTVTAFT